MKPGIPPFFLERANQLKPLSDLQNPRVCLTPKCIQCESAASTAGVLVLAGAEYKQPRASPAAFGALVSWTHSGDPVTFSSTSKRVSTQYGMGGRTKMKNAQFKTLLKFTGIHTDEHAARVLEVSEGEIREMKWGTMPVSPSVAVTLDRRLKAPRPI